MENVMPNKTELQSKLEACGQEHVLAFFDELSDSEQAGLLEQVNSIDLPRLEDLVAKYVYSTPEVDIPGNIDPPEVVSNKPDNNAGCQLLAEGLLRGEQLLAEGKVAAFVVAGGQGTRLGFEGPKGSLQATPVAHKSLFQLFAEKIRAASERSGKAIPWYIMTSPANDVATRAFFRQNNFFHLDPNDVMFLTQGMMPTLSMDGKLMLAGKGKIALSPNGHGGSLLALKTSGALEDMASRGIELISYFQVDNPLVNCVDPLFLGLHDLQGSQISAKCLPKRDPMEKIGNFCVAGDRTMVIEYSDMPDELATKTTDEGKLLFSAGSIAIHVFSRSFVEQLTAEGEAKCLLPLHRAEKKTPFVDVSGNLVKPETPNSVKLEMFVFDAMALAEKTLILRTRRSEEFSPIKNAEGEDSLVTSLHDQVRRAASWLEQAGVVVPRDADGQIAAALEISPLFADSAEKLKEKVSSDMEITSGSNVYLEN